MTQDLDDRLKKVNGARGQTGGTGLTTPLRMHSIPLCNSRVGWLDTRLLNAWCFVHRVLGDTRKEPMSRTMLFQDDRFDATSPPFSERPATTLLRAASAKRNVPVSICSRTPPDVEKGGMIGTCLFQSALILRAVDRVRPRAGRCGARTNDRVRTNE